MSEFRILVADDDEDDFFILKQAFADHGTQHRIERAKDGKQLLDILHASIHLKERLPDLIIMDINMPKVDGIRALEILKGVAILKGVPIIMYSTSTDSEQRIKCLKLGAENFHTKGSKAKEIEAFVNIIIHFLNQRKLKRGELQQNQTGIKINK
jgi:CheY-like chemotaxis protein